MTTREDLRQIDSPSLLPGSPLGRSPSLSAPRPYAPSEDSNGTGAASVTRTAGRGGLAVSAAKIYFIVVGLVQQIALKAVLGLDGYGALSSALSAASITYNPIVTASLQGMSRAVATATPAEQPAIVRTGLKLHAVLAIATATGFFLAAPLLGRLTGAPHIVPTLRVLSAVLGVYGLYAPLVGVLNGRTQFTAQAGLDAVAATTRTIGLLGGAWLFRSLPGGAVSGAALGFVISSAIVLAVATRIVRRPPRLSTGPDRPTSSRGFARRAYLKFVGPILLGQLLLNLLFQSDQLLLRRFAAEAALRAGLLENAADPLVGAYRAVQLFCFLPYQLVLAVGIVLFPLLAAAQRQGQNTRIGQYVLSSLRLALLVIGAIVSVTAGIPEALLTLVFGSDTAQLGTGAMLWLAPGLASLAVLGLLTAILTSLHSPHQALAVTAGAVVLVLGLCFYLVRGHGFGRQLLVRSSLATSAALLAAVAAAGLLVHRKVGKLVRPLAALRIAGCLSTTILLAHELPVPTRVWTLPACALLVTIYGALLVLTRELGTGDLRKLQQILHKKEA